MRLFLAVPISEKNRREIIDSLDREKREFPGVKWVSPEALHVTLLFLGETSKEMYDKTKEILLSVSSPIKPFQASFFGVSQFPPRGRPSVFIIPAKTGEEEFKILYKAVFSALSPYYILDKRPFTPHITLGRVREGERWPAVESLNFLKECSFTVNKFILYKSDLTP